MGTRKVGLSKKMGAVSLIVFLGFVSIIVLILYMVNKLSLIDQQMAEQNHLILDAQEVQNEMLAAKTDEVRLLLERNADHKKAAEQKIVVISLTVDRMIQSTQDEVMLAHIKNVKNLSFEYTLKLNEVAEQIEQQDQMDQMAASQVDHVEDFNRISASIEEEITAIQTTVQEQLTALTMEKERTLTRISNWIIFTSTVIGLLSVVAVGYIFRQSILQSVQVLAKMANELAEGDFTYRAQRKKKLFADEIEETLDKFELMQGNLASMLQTIHSFSKDVSVSSRQLLDNAEQVSQSSEAIASSGMEIASTMNQQASFIQQNVEKIGELVKQMDEVDEGASLVSSATQKADQALKEGEGMIHNLNEQMKKMESMIGETVQALEWFNQSSREIEEIVQIMSRMSDQTQMLALNASIEAARVGEQGRGFAVVADEIHKLAVASKQSTANISLRVLGIQESSSQIYQNMIESKEEVILGMNQAQATDELFGQIKESFHRVFEQIRDMKAAIRTSFEFSQNVDQSSQQMWKELNDIHCGLESISAGSQEQTASIEEITASIEKLSAEATELFQAVQRFKLPENEFSYEP